MSDVEEKKVSIIDPFGKEVNGIEIEVVSQTGHWTLAELKDGTLLKIQPIILKVVRTDQFGSNGEPLYVVKSQDVVLAEVNDKGLYEKK